MVPRHRNGTDNGNAGYHGEPKLRSCTFAFNFSNHHHQNRLRQYFDSTIQPLLSTVGMTVAFYDLAHAYSLVSSRAFHIDAYHGLSMVPIADA